MIQRARSGTPRNASSSQQNPDLLARKPHIMENRLSREWDLFEGGPTLPFEKRMHVSLCRKGIVYMNQTVHRMMGGPAAVRLYYNRELGQIALQPSIDRVAISFPVRQHGVKGWQVHAAPFCKHYGIRLDGTERFLEPEITGGVLKLSLGKTIRIAQRSKKKRITTT